MADNNKHSDSGAMVTISGTVTDPVRTGWVSESHNEQPGVVNILGDSNCRISGFHPHFSSLPRVSKGFQAPAQYLVRGSRGTALAMLKVEICESPMILGRENNYGTLV